MDEVGTRLREARAQRGLSLEDVAMATKVPKASLTNLEAGRYDLLPAPVFIRGFIRSYARAVGLDPNPVVRAYENRTLPLPPAPGTEVRLSAAAARIGAVGRRLGYGPADEPQEPSLYPIQTGGPRLDPESKLVPVQPVSMRREGGLKGGFMLIAVAAAGLLIAAWILVGQKQPTSDGAAQVPTAPVIHERIDGMPSFDGPGGDLRVPATNPARPVEPRNDVPARDGTEVPTREGASRTIQSSTGPGGPGGPGVPRNTGSGSNTVNPTEGGGSGGAGGSGSNNRGSAVRNR
jgi:hypothetical protein